jgi:protein O-mannosyl-transferase
LALTAALYVFRDRIGRGALTAWLAFAGTLAPALGFFNYFPMKYSIVADHFQYLASAAILVLAVSSAVRWIGCSVKGGIVLRRLVGPAVLLLFAMSVWRQSKNYESVETLWRDTISKNPACWMAHINLGCYYSGQGRLDDALEQFHETIRIKPDYAEAYLDAGNMLQIKGLFEQSIGYYRQALRLRPDLPEPYTSWGRACVSLGRWDEGVRLYRQALRIRPHYVQALVNLAEAYMQKAEWNRVLELGQLAVSVEPDNIGALNVLGSAYLALGQLQQAGEQFSRFVELAPNNEYAHKGLGDVYHTQGILDKAVESYQKALAINPSNVDAHSRADTLNRYGVALVKLGRHREAEDHFKEALRLDPQFGQARENLKFLKRSVSRNP